jgi:hypothetical protein
VIVGQNTIEGFCFESQIGDGDGAAHAVFGSVAADFDAVFGGLAIPEQLDDLRGIRLSC